MFTHDMAGDKGVAHARIGSAKRCSSLATDPIPTGQVLSAVWFGGSHLAIGPLGLATRTQVAGVLGVPRGRLTRFLVAFIAYGYLVVLVPVQRIHEACSP
jgi:hypothetical protein